jgi:hypothetical protein
MCLTSVGNPLRSHGGEDVKSRPEQYSFSIQDGANKPRHAPPYLGRMFCP